MDDLKLTNDRKEYMKHEYSLYWSKARDNIYGFSEYDLQTCEIMTRFLENKVKVLEVGVGTGYPFADYFQKKGKEIHGVDISSDLVKQCLEFNPSIHAIVGDAENLKYEDHSFDMVYCLHSSWYFPDLKKAISEMLRVVRNDGVVFFDVQNMINSSILSAYKKNIFFNTTLLGKIYKTLRNIIKMFLRRGIVDWSFITYETPTDPIDLGKWLSSMGCEIEIWGQKDSKLVLIDLLELGSIGRYPRLCYKIKKC